MKLSVFDLDKTLASCNVSFAFGRFLVKKKKLSFMRAVLLGGVYGLHKAHLLSLFALHKSSFWLFFYKKNTCEIGGLADEFLTEVQEGFLRPSILAQLRTAQRSGEVVWILSSSPEFLVRRIAVLLDVDHFAGSCYQEDEWGKFSHICHIMDGKRKEAVLDQFLQGNTLKMGWEAVTVYSDSILDLPLLEKAAKPVAVFPDSALLKVAKAKQWRVWNE